MKSSQPRDSYVRKIPLLHPDRRLERFGVKSLTSRPFPIGKNCLHESVIIVQRRVLVQAVLIESLCDADQWMIEDIRIGQYTLKFVNGTRFLEYPIFGSSDGNKLPSDGNIVCVGQVFAVTARYIGPKPLGEVFIASLYGEVA
jgi:hypothetical protein